MNGLELWLLGQIICGKIDDDANLTGDQQKAATSLYQQGYIAAVMVEGSDEPVEALWATKKGKMAGAAAVLGVVAEEQ